MKTRCSGIATAFDGASALTGERGAFATEGVAARRADSLPMVLTGAFGAAERASSAADEAAADAGTDADAAALGAPLGAITATGATATGAAAGAALPFAAADSMGATSGGRGVLSAL
ncbi:MAG TPA: hypothetical protein VFQ35_08775 [Polyangiaceae bacterium]|nr:hypothetical protein [Polyangiaceae bacterium]